MEIKELETVCGMVFVIRDRLKADIEDMIARGMIDELYDQLKEKNDPEADFILEQLLMIRVLLRRRDDRRC
ncbi:MAG: hypothetical protein WC178_03450 [Candidatus Paceibacterota bacterium]